MHSSDARTLIRDAYYSVDRRILGCFRIAYGSVLLYDVTRRAFDLRLLYSNDGVLPNHFQLFAPQVAHQFSIYTAFSTPGEVAFAFALTYAAYTAYVLGLYTRVAQVLALLCVTSLNQRNLFSEDGGMSTMIALGVWTLFLPLGDRYSLDALRRDATLRTIRERISRRQTLAVPVRSLAVTAITLQVVAIYALNVAHKSGSTWRDGSSVHYVLWQNRVNTLWGNWLAHHEPGWLSPLLTYGTLAVEWAIPLLVLSPWYRPLARSLAFVLAIGLHGSIALIMTLGPFSYAMLSLVSLTLPPQVLEGIGRRLPARWRLRSLRARARALAFVARRWSRPVSPLPHSPARQALQGLGATLREGILSVLILVNTLQVAVDNRAIRRVVHVKQPAAFATLVGYLRMIQSWNMFAPVAPKRDGMVVVDATTAGGRHIDPFTGKAPDFEIGVYAPVPHSLQVTDYLFSIQLRDNERYRGQLRDYLVRWHTLAGRPEVDRIVSYDVWWADHQSPAPGSKQPTDFHRNLVFRGP